MSLSSYTMTSPDQHVYPGHDECHKAAIALNNTAVGLLVRGFYRDALDTFQDATKLIKIVAESEKDAAVQARETLDEVVRLSLQRTWQRAAFPKGNQFNIQTSASAEGVCTFLKAVSSEYDPTTINEALTICSGSLRTTKCPMTIDPIDFESTSEMVTAVHFHSSVLLYNFAIAYECWATTAVQSKPSSAQGLHPVMERAYRIFQLSESVLVQQYRDCQEHSASNIHAFEKIMQLKLFVTHNLIEASSRLGMPFEYQEHGNNMNELLLLIKSGELLLPVAETRAAGAA